MYIPRHLEPVVQQATTTFPVVMVTGPRQVGKTTLLESLAEQGRAYVSLDSPLNREMAKTDPELFLHRYPPPVFIDEFQHAKELLPYIKIHVDKHKRNGDFWLTGSQMFPMMKQVGESLAGRVAVIPMQGLSHREISKLDHAPFSVKPKEWISRLATSPSLTVLDVFERIFQGSLPRTYSEHPNRELFYSSYVDTYLQRDIREMTGIGNELAFLRFMTACAARTAQQVTYTELARDVGISSPTAKQWLSLLATSGIVMLVEPYFNNALTRIVKSPKMYFMDTGLATYLTRWESPATLEVSMMSGALFETYVMSEIVKNYYNSARRPPIYYYRDTQQREIDLIIEADNVLHPFEIKKSASPGRGSIRHFNVLEKTQKKIGAGGVICMTDTVIPIDSQNHFIPAWLM